MDPLLEQAYSWIPYRYGYNMMFIDQTRMLEDDFMIHNLSNFGDFLRASTGYSLGFEYMTLKVGA